MRIVVSTRINELEKFGIKKPDGKDGEGEE
jgi:hypothetical protein